jgi:hypothetical protein
MLLLQLDPALLGIIVLLIILLGAVGGPGKP